MAGNIDPELRKQINDAAQAADEFMKHYYDNIDHKKLTVNKLFLDTALLVYNGNGFKGIDAITKFVNDMPKTEHTITTIDAQPILDESAGKTILIQVSGTVKIGGQRSKAFQQSFTVTAQNQKWKIVTDCFRLQEGICGEIKATN